MLDKKAGIPEADQQRAFWELAVPLMDKVLGDDGKKRELRALLTEADQRGNTNLRRWIEQGMSTGTASDVELKLRDAMNMATAEYRSRFGVDPRGDPFAEDPKVFADIIKFET